MQTLKSTTFLMRPTITTSAEGGTQSAQGLDGGRIRKPSGEPEEMPDPAYESDREGLVELHEPEGRSMHAWISVYELVQVEYERLSHARTR